MFILNLKPIFKARGVERPYSFLVKSGFTYNAATLLLNSKTASFRLAHIEKLCEILYCTPNDLLKWTPNRDTKLPETHPLTKLKSQNIDSNWFDNIKTMPLDQLKEIVAKINRQNKP